MHGIHLFMFQEGPGHATYPKWALLSHDGTPKHKLAAYSDAVQEVHRLEPLLMAARYTHAVKPVAMYWSRIDLGLDKPHDSLHGHSLNSPIHVYRTLRGLGYPVRWMTPRQITEGELEAEEIAQQPGTTHPIALALGDFMVAGIGLERVECLAGKVVGMTHTGRPGFVVNGYGQGQALYSALLLGTIYEAAPARSPLGLRARSAQRPGGRAWATRRSAF